MKTRVLRWITELVLVGMLAGLLFGCGKKDADDSSGKSTESKASSDVETSEDVTESTKEKETGTNTTEDATKATSEETTSESTTVETKVTTSEETLQETSQNTEIPTEPTRSLSDEEAEMSRLRDEEVDDDGEEEYEDPSGNGNGNGNGGNGGTTTTQPTYATEPTYPDTSPDQHPGHWETRVIAEAWDETVVDQEAWDEEVKTAVGTQWIQNDTGTDMSGWSSAQKFDWCDSHNCPNHCDEYDDSQSGYCAFNCTGKTIYETQIVHHDAVTHVVHHDAVTEQVWVED